MNELVLKLAKAWVEGGHLGELPASMIPADCDQAYAVQAGLVAALAQPIAAWKVGMMPTGEILCSPILKSRVYSQGAVLDHTFYRPCAVELELAVRFSRSFPKRDTPYTDAEVLGSLAEMTAAVEIVTSRLEGWPDRDPWLKLADFNNNGALVLGAPVPFDQALERLDCPANFTLAGKPVFEGRGHNPAGEPLILLTTMVNQCAQRGLPIESHHWITTGTYTGCKTVNEGGALAGQLSTLPPIRLTI
jgi:2-keto-4-pentenoate hydratase